MKAVLSELVSQIDLIESQSTASFPWKRNFDQIMDEVTAVDASANKEGENSGNALFRILTDQNKVLTALVLLVLITNLKDKGK